MNDLTRRMIGMHACVSWGELPNKIHLVIPDQGGTACGLPIPENVERAWYGNEGACLGGHGCKTCAEFVRSAQRSRAFMSGASYSEG